MTRSEPNRQWGRALVRGLIAAGVEKFFLSPGARSTPIVAALAEIAPERVAVHYDERGMAFAALGWAKATERLAAAVTTSGSAVANLHPAVIEAAYGETPLVLLTADRPPELHGRGANQTIQQQGLFTGSARMEVALECPGDFPDPDARLRQVVEAVRCASRPPRGPVHINAPFREPLLDGQAQDETEIYSSVQIPASPVSPGGWFDDTASALRSFFNEPNGVIVIGALSVREQANLPEIMLLGRNLGWPVFPDALSGGVGREGATAHVDFILHRRDIPSPRRLLHFGGPFVSKRLAKWLEPCRGAAYLQVRESPRQLDPLFQNPEQLRIEAGAFCREASRLIDPGDGHHPTAWAEMLYRWERVARHLIAEQVDQPGTLTEPAIARAVAATWKGGLFIGNSMPIRDFDTFAGSGPTKVLFGNRGASGIDGNIATVAGIALGLGTSVLGLIGDLACLHDLSSLALLGDLPVALLVVNNRGGGIFRFVPEGLPAEQRERFWETPHEMDFEGAARQFRLRYESPTSRRELEDLLHELSCQGISRPILIECRTDRAENAALHRQLANRMRAAALA